MTLALAAYNAGMANVDYWVADTPGAALSSPTSRSDDPAERGVSRDERCGPHHGAAMEHLRCNGV